MKTKEEFIEELKKLSVRETITDMMATEEDVVIDDFAGGNVDDAYYSGVSDGEAILARKVLKILIND